MERIPSEERVPKIDECLQYYTMFTEAIHCQETVKATLQRKICCSDDTKVMERSPAKEKVPALKELSHHTPKFHQATSGKKIP